MRTPEWIAFLLTFVSPDSTRRLCHRIAHRVVEPQVHLVDVVSGQTLWSGEQTAVEGSGGGGGLIGMAIAAVVAQIIDTLSDRTYELSRQANYSMIFDRDNGFLKGPYHPGYANDPRVARIEFIAAAKLLKFQRGTVNSIPITHIFTA